LESIDFIKDGNPNEEKIRKININVVAGLANYISNMEEPEPEPGLSADAPLAFSASPALSGGRHECTHIECRERRVRELIRFSTLFSDVVHVRNGFSDFCVDPSHPTIEDSATFRKKVIDEVRILCVLRPVLEAGLVKFFTPKTDICLVCFAKKNLGPDVAERIVKAHELLAGRFKKELKAEVSWDGYEYDIHCEGSKRLVDNIATASSYDELPPEILKYPGLANRIHSTGRSPIPRIVWNKLGLYNKFALGISDNVYYHLAVAQSLHSVFLTHNELHADFLQSALGTPELGVKNQIAAKHLSASIPFVDAVPVEKLIQLRRDEPHAFVLFRSSLMKSAAELRGSGSAFNEKHARELYGDVLQPGLAKLEEKMKSAREDALRSSAKSAAAFALTLSFGLHLGLLPTEIQAALSALGLWKFSNDFLGKVGDAVDPQRTIRGESLYFLWRMKKLSR